MSKETNGWLAWLRTFFAGDDGELPTAAPGSSDHVLVVLQRVNDEDIEIGVLAREDGTFVFSYIPTYLGRQQPRPISAFPSLSPEPYRSTELWPFFAVRIPPLDRDDVRELIEASELDPTDKIRLLAETSPRSITSPYVFELRRRSASGTFRALAH